MVVKVNEALGINYELEKSPPAPYITRYMDMLNSCQELAIFSLGIKSGLFAQLKEGHTIKELLSKTNWHEAIAHRLLQCMYAYGFINKHGKYYKNSVFTNNFATSSSPFAQLRTLSAVHFNQDMHTRIINALNGPPKEKVPITEVFNAPVLLSMAEHCIRGGLQQTVSFLCRHKKVREAKKMLDLGGGHSLYTIALTRRNPELRAVLFDLPDVVEGAAKPVVKSYGAERIDFIKGDFMKDDIGNNYDLVLCSDVLHRPEKEILFILTKINTAMQEGGLLAVKETHLNDLKKNRFAAYFSLVLSTFDPEQRIFSSKGFNAIIERSGFKVRANIALEAASDSSYLTLAERV